MAGWRHLPAELRFEVLRLLMLDKRQKCPDRRWRRRGVLATVCKEWQSFVERYSFSHLTIRQSDISEFASIVRGQRRTHVKWVCLRIELPCYDDGDDYKRPESRKEIRTHNLLLTNAVWSLFEVLSDWPKAGDSDPGMTLELSAYSPSDLVYQSRELGLRRWDTTYGKVSSAHMSHFDSLHQSFRFAVSHPNDGEMQRAFGPWQGLRFDMGAACVKRTRKRLPKLEAIESLIIRGQFFRGFSGTKALWPVVRSLTQLEEFTYESWRAPGREGRNEDHIQLFRNAFKFSHHLKRVSAYGREYGDRYRHEPLRSDASLDKMLRASRKLEELHLSFLVEARDFFEADIHHAESGGNLEWPNLRRLSLSSRLLSSQNFNDLIQMAAGTAQKMSKLEVMELWGYEMGGCIFRYERRLHKPLIVFLSTWRYSLCAESRAVWELLAQKWGFPGELEVVEGFLPLKRDARCRADVIPHLKLKDRILHPNSLKQIEQNKAMEL